MTITTRRPATAPPRLDLLRSALFLDLDGTLAPIAPRPQDVGPDPRRTAVLKRLVARMEGRIAILSGRTLAEIDHILEGAVTPAAGVHGLERRGLDGRRAPVAPDAALPGAREAFRRLAASASGLLVEDKGLSVALHYRQAPEAGEAALALAREIAETSGLALQPGHMVVELRTPGADKGQALAGFMAEPPFTGARPVFVGDDLTDEPAFAAADLAGGHGILVGPERNTAARFRLDDVNAVLDWLEAAL